MIINKNLGIVFLKKLKYFILEGILSFIIFFNQMIYL